MKATTETLESNISSAEDFDVFLSEYGEDLGEKTLAQYLAELLEIHGISKRTVLERTYIDLNYGYQIFNGTKKKPARDFLLQIAVAFPLDLKETRRLLYYGGAGGLYPRVKRDAYLMFALEKGYSPEQVNHYFMEHGLEPFFKE